MTALLLLMRRPRVGILSPEDAISIVSSFTIHRIVHDRIWLGVRITLRLRS